MEWLFPVASALVAGLTGYLIARRRESGRIDVTEAEQLWEEARAQRLEMQRQIDRLQLEVLRLRVNNHELRTQLTEAVFFGSAEIPNEVKQRVLDRQRAHTEELRQAVENLQEEFDARETTAG